MRTISFMFMVLVLIAGCYKKPDLKDALEIIQESAESTPVFYTLDWYDTGETCRLKLMSANIQIIQISNKLFVIDKQLENLINNL